MLEHRNETEINCRKCDELSSVLKEKELSLSEVQENYDIAKKMYIEKEGTELVKIPIVP